MTPIDASKKENEERVLFHVHDKRQKHKPEYNLDDLVRTADIKKVFSKGASTNYSYDFYTITEKLHDTIPSNRIDYLPERYKKPIKTYKINP